MPNTSSCFGLSVTTRFLTLFPRSLIATRAARSERDLEIWKPNRQVREIARGMVLRIQAAGTFMLRWSLDEWRTITDSTAYPTDLGISFVDIPIPLSQANSIEFTFLWGDGRWEGTNYRVNVRDLD